MPFSARPQVYRANKRAYFTEFPINTISGIGTVNGILGVLQQHDMGLFNQSAMLVDAMMRSDRIRGVTGQRLGTVLSAPLEVRAANKQSLASKVADWLGGTDEEPGAWEELFPRPVIGDLLRWGMFCGIGVAEILWPDTAKSEWGWSPRLRVVHPQWIRWDRAWNCYVVMTPSGEVQLPNLEDYPEGDGQWFQWCPYGYRGGWLMGLVRALADLYLMRGWNYRDWARFNEKHGSPILGVRTPGGIDQDIRDSIIRNIANMGSEGVIELPYNDENNHYDAKAIEMMGRSWETFQAFKKELDADIAIAVVGQNLTTQVGGSGSLAASKTHKSGANEIAITDGGIATEIRKQVLSQWAKFNLGDATLAPRPKLCVEAAEDEAAETAALKSLGDAVSALKLAEPATDSRAILDKFGVPMKSEEEMAAEAADRAEQMAAAGGQSGGLAPGGSADGGAGSAGVADPAKEKRRAQLSTLPGARTCTFAGLPIVVENPAGTIRRWSEVKDGVVTTIGATTMKNDYGFIDGHMGSDGDEVDCYIGPDPGAQYVYVVHQLRAPDFRAHDEDKCFLGFASADAALDAYKAHRNDGDRAVGGMSTIPLGRFIAKLERRGGTGKIHARADLERETIAALIALADRDPGTAALRARRSPGGKVRTKFYSDQVSAKAKPLAARALATDLVGMKEDIDACSSFDDLKARLVRRYKGMDPERLARVVEKSRIMANLGGRKAVLDQI